MIVILDAKYTKKSFCLASTQYVHGILLFSLLFPSFFPPIILAIGHSPDSSDPSLQCHYNPLSRDPVAGFQSKEEELGGRRDNQYSVSSFCSSVISNVAPILVDHLDRDFPWASSSSSGNTRELSLPVFAAGFAGKCLQLLEVAMDMLELEVQRCRLSSVRVEDIEKVKIW